MPSILKIRRYWSLLNFEIRTDRSPHKILKIRRDWSFPFGEIGVPRNNNNTCTNNTANTTIIRASHLTVIQLLLESSSNTCKVKVRYLRGAFLAEPGT